ncbi:hypothetical protein B9Z55_003302 [Caenorhabditis nigoni]|nr:hypothetical protein B9Z55_003302 [Caenorhabditis nigoni]
MPFLVQKMIIEELGLDERLFLSTTSKRTCRLLGMFKINVKAISIKVTRSYVEVEVGDRPFLQWTFTIPFEQCEPGSSLLKVDGSSFTYYHPSSFDWKYEGVELKRKKNAGIVLGKLLRHLTSFLNIERYLECDCDRLSPGLIPQLDFNHVYDSIEIRHKRVINMTPEDLKFVLENVRTKVLRLNVKVTSIRGYKYQKNPDKEASIDRLEIENYGWVDFSELPAAKDIRIEKKIQLDHMNTILGSWIAGKNRYMEIGDFYLGEFAHLNREIIFKDIETYATQLTNAEIDSWFRNSRYLPNRRYLYNQIVVDIMRTDDGLRATVIEVTHRPDPQSNRRMFVMVWTIMKLHRMPYLVQKMIVEELGFNERLFLSVTSRRTCSLLGMFKVNLDSISITVDTDDIRITVWKTYFDEWTFKMPFNQRHWRGSSTWRIDGSVVQVGKGQYSAMYCRLNDERLATTENAMTVFVKLLRHLKSFLNVRECRHCFLRIIPVGFIPQLDCDLVYDLLNISNLKTEPVAPEYLEFILENVQTKVLRLDVKVPSVRGYKYRRNPEKERVVDRLQIQNYSWVDFSELPVARAISIQSKIRLYDMNTILKSWIAGRNRDMEIGDFELGRYSPRNRKIIFNDVETHVTESTEANMDSWFTAYRDLPDRSFLHNVTAVDILRETDGTRATVVEATNRPEHQSKRRMFVLVWSEANLRPIGQDDN